jgi:ABC-type glutathione transport system ATPase component
VSTPLLEVHNLVKPYPVGSRRKGALLHAVDDVDLTIGEGESVGLVGESGCGKSPLARLLAQLIEPSSGRIVFDGRELTSIAPARFVRSRGRARIQVVFQDPTESLNPSFRVFDSIADPLHRLLGVRGATDLDRRVRHAAELVGLPDELIMRDPHQLSGGQRARVGIARAIAVERSLLILDEPTSALDVSVQAVILRLLADLPTRLGRSYLFVSHDLNVVRLLCERIVVMYLGRVVEVARTETMLPRRAITTPRHLSQPFPTRRAAVAPRRHPTSPIVRTRTPAVSMAAARPARTVVSLCRRRYATCHFA